MATCPSCGQPLGGDDRFCTGCGKAVSDSRPAATAAVAGNAPASSPASGFRWKWALLTIPIAVGTFVAFCFVASLVAAAMGTSLDDSAPQAVFAALLLGSMAGAGFVVGWFSPGRTVYEPAVGLVATTVVLNLLFGGADTNPVGDWLLPFALGAGGAWLGEWLQGRFATR